MNAPTAQIAPQMVRKRNTGLIALGGLAVASIVVGVVLLATRNKGDADATPSAAAEPATPTEPAPPPPAQAAPAPAPPAVAPAPTPAPAPAPAPTPVKVTLKFDSKPAGGAVFVGSEGTERCKTPCSFQLDRADTDASITVKLAGFGDEQRTLSLKSDGALSVVLAKKHSTVAAKPPAPATPATPPPPHQTSGPKDKHDPKRPVGDNTLNPFDN